MKQLWLLCTALGLFLFLGTAGAVETDSISLAAFLVQTLAGGALLYLGQVLRKKAQSKARAAARKRSVRPAPSSGTAPAVHPRGYHRAA